MLKILKEKREFDPIKGTWPNPKTVKCCDCVHRDKTIVMIGERNVAVGVTRSFCGVYTKEVNGKPHEILFKNTDCIYYIKDEDNV